MRRRSWSPDRSAFVVDRASSVPGAPQASGAAAISLVDGGQEAFCGRQPDRVETLGREQLTGVVPRMIEDVNRTAVDRRLPRPTLYRLLA